MTGMPTPTDEDDKIFNSANQTIENALTDNDPSSRTPDGPFAEIQTMLCLIWKAIGGEVKETWQDERQRLYAERRSRDR